jgi:hypothetical protein
MTDRKPWICPRCETVIAPWVDEHRCGPDDGVTAKRPDAPLSPFTTTSVTTTFPGGSGGAGGCSSFTGDVMVTAGSGGGGGGGAG